MNTQQVVSLIVTLPKSAHLGANETIIHYPELNSYFEQDMYIENIHQTLLSDGKCLVTFLFRYDTSHHAAPTEGLTR